MPRWITLALQSLSQLSAVASTARMLAVAFGLVVALLAIVFGSMAAFVLGVAVCCFAAFWPVKGST
jgi:hypothetical protein